MLTNRSMLYDLFRETYHTIRLTFVLSLYASSYSHSASKGVSSSAGLPQNGVRPSLLTSIYGEEVELSASCRFISSQNVFLLSMPSGSYMTVPSVSLCFIKSSIYLRTVCCPVGSAVSYTPSIYWSNAAKASHL